MRKLLCIAGFSIVLLAALAHRCDAQSQSSVPSVLAQTSAPQTAPQSAAPGGAQLRSADAYPQPTYEHKITAYTLPPERDRKARQLARLRLIMTPVSILYGLLVLLLVLRWRFAPKYRDIAEHLTTRRILQSLIFSPLIFLTIDALSLPVEIFRNSIRRAYGISVQSWPSWFWDWLKGELLSFIAAFLLVWILYAIIRRSRRRWWFYFWLISMPIALFLFFIEPLVVDPLFHKFEPLEQKDPALTAALESMVQHAGQSIPPERMFWMGAGEKTTGLNAYVTGFGASKRIVVWDTTIAKMNTPQIVFVAGHELGHYVLGHIPKLIAFFFALLFVFFYLTDRLIGALLARRGSTWQIRELGDWASLPALLFILTVLFTLATPVASSFGRYQEHQADQYSLEVTHGLTPDSGQIGAQAFQILGEVNLADPAPNPSFVFIFYDHPDIPSRVRFALSYDPWSQNESPEFVK